MDDEVRPVGHISTTRDGKSHLPSILRKEVGITGAGKIPFYLDANCVLLVRKGATLDDIVRGLDILKEDLKLRSNGS